MKISNKAQLKAMRDKQQFHFEGAANFIIVDKQDNIQAINDLKQSEYLCPFCLHRGYLHDFKVVSKKGKKYKMLNCPECNNKFHQDSLTKQDTPEKYAQWCFNYRKSGFWQKIKFEQWNERLNKIGWSYAFWKQYKNFKNNTPKEDNYEEHMNKEAEQWMKLQQEQEGGDN